MSLAPHPAEFQLWPGFDRAFHDDIAVLGQMPEGIALRDRLDRAYALSEDRGVPIGQPTLVRDELALSLTRFVAAYHRAIEAIVEASLTDGRVMEVLSTPGEIARDVDEARNPKNGRVHLCRLDILPSPDGGFWVLETNANCPGGLVFVGGAVAMWREFLDARGVHLPPPMANEDPTWMARWFLDVAEAETGVRPQRIGLLRKEGGNRLEMDEFRECFASVGVEAVEADPRELSRSSAGQLELGGGPIGHAYLKLGIQPFCDMRSELDVFVESLHDRSLFVQNGLRGRWIGDNKLCLAVLYDEAFRYLFDPDDWALIHDHIPWSANLALCPNPEVAEIRRHPEDFVLKRPLDTRGRGVVIGPEIEDPEAWNAAVDVALEQGWLVQEFVTGTEIEPDPGSVDQNRHDLALGAINGKISAVFMRSSSEMRVNVARSGRLHPVFMRG